MSDNSNLANEMTEPSMEDILSSIRKVIAEDLSKKQAIDNAQAADGMDIRAEADLADEVTLDETTGAETTGAEVVDIDECEPADIEIADLVATGLQDTVEDTTEDTAKTGKDETPVDEILELDELVTGIDGDEGVMELVQLEDVLSTTPIEQAQEFVTLPDPQNDSAEDPLASLVTASLAGNVEGEQPSAVDFDETLDLVMDADASDYVTTKFAAPERNSEASPAEFDPLDGLLEDVLEDAESESASDWHVKGEVFKPASTSDFKPESDSGQAGSDANINADADADEDMDLVKSLLEDLMDEPITEAVDSAVGAEISLDTLGNFTEDDLLIPDPNDIQAEADIKETPAVLGETLVEPSHFDNEIALELDIDDIFDLGADTNADTSVEEATTEIDSATAFDSIEIEPEADALEEPTEPEALDSELAQIAREIAEASETVTRAEVDNQRNADDVVELHTPDFASKLALETSLTASATAIAANRMNDDTATKDNEISDLQDLQQLLEDPAQEELTQEDLSQEKSAQPDIYRPQENPSPQTSTKEDETMATPLKDDALSDSDTQEEVGNAFASLTSAVQEQAQIEENGPPIGELVKEALKPMLQEWLDKNLKSMVQRAVTKEIKRISSSK
ncbi:MAG: DUF2497 domain-containing protein [Robiginitomaculum sp.]|nr:DUF2497 domain-containing protein [Robiginitomaculum sp.]